MSLLNKERLLTAAEAKTIADLALSLEHTLNKIRGCAEKGFYATSYTVIANNALWGRMAHALRELGYRVIVLDRTKGSMVTFNINWEFGV